jgi:D-glycero-D-manno-heptose 1,7-bisphosphate phosphatase
MRKAIFLDRDGVLNVDIHPYVSRLEQLEIFSYTADSLQRLHEAGYDLFVVSNQQGVSVGITSPEELEKMTEAIQDVLRPRGFEIRKFYYATERDSANHPWRKPSCGMLHAARDEFGVALEGAFVVGDKWSDIQMASVAGCRPLLVLSGVTGPTQWQRWSHQPEKVFENLRDAADWILEQ